MNAKESRPAADSVTSAVIQSPSIERLTTAIDLLNRRQTLWFSFWHGLVVGIGSTAGVAIILSFAAWLLNRLNFIPGVDEIRHILQSLPGQSGN